MKIHVAAKTEKIFLRYCTLSGSWTRALENIKFDGLSNSWTWEELVWVGWSSQNDNIPKNVGSLHF